MQCYQKGAVRYSASHYRCVVCCAPKASWRGRCAGQLCLDFLCNHTTSYQGLCLSGTGIERLQIRIIMPYKAIYKISSLIICFQVHLYFFIIHPLVFEGQYIYEVSRKFQGTHRYMIRPLRKQFLYTLRISNINNLIEDR